MTQASTLNILPYSNESLCSYKKCVWVFVAALFIVIPNGKQARYPSTGEGITRLCYIHKMEYPSAVRESQLLTLYQLGCISEALCWVKESILKRLHTGWFYCYEKLKAQGCSDGELIRGLSVARMWLCSGIAAGSFGGDGMILCVGYDSSYTPYERVKAHRTIYTPKRSVLQHVNLNVWDILWTKASVIDLFL